MEGNEDDDLYGDLLAGQTEEGQGHYRAEAEEVCSLIYKAVPGCPKLRNPISTESNVCMRSSKASCRQRSNKCSSYRPHLKSHRQR